MSASLLSLGFLLGMRHAIESDHVAAVASLATNSGSRGNTVRLAAAWGAGHTLTLFLFCSLVVLLDSAMPEQMAQGLELAVGLLLIGLGGDVLRRLWRDGKGYPRAGSAPPGTSACHQRARFPVRALLVGMMHGMAGSAALILLALQSTYSPLTGMFYVLLFGIGSMAGMLTLSAVIALPLGYAASLGWLHLGVMSTVGSITLGVGGWMVYDIGISGGLLL